ncbi:unnamed protein product [Dimorphilus gyrociliatus]|uniref:Uncharacterized protein n=1 Tax=Dimorphilus gyrociliatus TaxID=2664684 RepID=A0A7I8VQ46_9ANNE|nr:unnamed protein product [Dimorphilus gyrociliatus]
MLMDDQINFQVVVDTCPRCQVLTKIPSNWAVCDGKLHECRNCGQVRRRDCSKSDKLEMNLILEPCRNCGTTSKDDLLAENNNLICKVCKKRRESVRGFINDYSPSLRCSNDVCQGSKRNTCTISFEDGMASGIKCSCGRGASLPNQLPNDLEPTCGGCGRPSKYNVILTLNQNDATIERINCIFCKVVQPLSDHELFLPKANFSLKRISKLSTVKIGDLICFYKGKGYLRYAVVTATNDKTLRVVENRPKDGVVKHDVRIDLKRHLLFKEIDCIVRNVVEKAEKRVGQPHNELFYNALDFIDGLISSTKEKNRNKNDDLSDFLREKLKRIQMYVNDNNEKVQSLPIMEEKKETLLAANLLLEGGSCFWKIINAKENNDRRWMQEVIVQAAEQGISIIGKAIFGVTGSNVGYCIGKLIGPLIASAIIRDEQPILQRRKSTPV